MLDVYSGCGFFDVTVTLALEAAAHAGVPTKDVLGATDESGDTPLHYAARAGMVASVVKLMEAGADPALRNADGLTAADAAGQRWPAIDAALKTQPKTQDAPKLEGDHSEAAAQRLLDSVGLARSGGGWYSPAPSADESCDSATADALSLMAGVDTADCVTLDSLDWETFRRDHLSLSRPVLVRRPAAESDSWRAWARWRRMELQRHYGSIPVHSGVIPCKPPPQIARCFARELY